MIISKNSSLPPKIQFWLLTNEYLAFNIYVMINKTLQKWEVEFKRNGIMLDFIYCYCLFGGNYTNGKFHQKTWEEIRLSHSNDKQNSFHRPKFAFDTHRNDLDNIRITTPMPNVISAGSTNWFEWIDPCENYCRLSSDHLKCLSIIWIYYFPIFAYYWTHFEKNRKFQTAQTEGNCSRNKH